MTIRQSIYQQEILPMAELLFGALLRILQALLQGAPFILSGICITALLERMLGLKDTKRLFGSNSIISLFQSWCIGMALPGCSLGVIPICHQMRASGIAIGTIFAFALSSPLFDPLSLLYGLTLSKPFTIFAFAGCSLVVVTLSGAIFDKVFPNTELQTQEQPEVPVGIRRILAVAIAMARISVGPMTAFIGVGLLGVGIMSVVLPHGVLSGLMGHNNPWAPMVMTGVALPAYATPMVAMSQLGSMFQHGNSIGAAFILLCFGAGMNLGLIAWMWWHYGWKKLSFWFGLMLLIVIGISYGIERPLYPQAIEASDHSHAFDRYTAPFIKGYTPSNGYGNEIIKRITVETQVHEWIGAIALFTLAVCGGLLKLLDPKRRLDVWLTQSADQVRPHGRYDIILPAPVLGLCGLAGIITISIAGCFAYYPEPDEALEELKVATLESTTAAMGNNPELCLHWIPICEGWNKRLLVGMYLRKWEVSEEILSLSRNFGKEVDELGHMFEHRHFESAIRRQALAVDRARAALYEGVQKNNTRASP